MTEERGDSFGGRLRRLRRQAHLSQEELAERAGLTRNAVGALERGERLSPYPYTVRRLVDALDASDAERAALLRTVPRRSGSADAVYDGVRTPGFAALPGAEVDRARASDGTCGRIGGGRAPSGARRAACVGGGGRTRHRQDAAAGRGMPESRSRRMARAPWRVPAAGRPGAVRATAPGTGAACSITERGASQ